MSQSDILSNSMKKATLNQESHVIIEDIDVAHKELDILQQEVDKVIFGQNHVIEYALTSILAGGHALLVGVPGLAKTRLVETLGRVLGLDEKRIQFTPDLMPSDIIGSEIMDSDKSGKRSFRYLQGPIFTQLLMADEINRASPRTQSALLQAMQEYHVTVAGTRYDLPQPFHVLATQNPLEQEGTYPLPEAQLDRFLMQIDIDYPDLTTERRIILETTRGKNQNAKPVLSTKTLQKIQKIVRKMPISENVVEAILKLVRSARPHKDNSLANTYVAWGPGPRASQALSLCARARALYHGRLTPSLDDIATLARPVLQHRMALNFSARAENITIKDIIDNLVKDAL
ncbi:AAA family ATPase [Bartonella senegalensis]|uniref:AAA family ATPase n=1 Tax=Bartonella senegalensis TaxID=1468418 RepID=UPI0003119AD1|nr:MoxR family ATPase [Bartonella senegalensis]